MYTCNRKVEMMKIEYDGSYPNLCSGHLIVHIDDTKYDFGCYCLSSGGGISFDADFSEIVTSGPWTLVEDSIPSDFPKDRLPELRNLIDSEIPQGCCGGYV